MNNSKILYRIFIITLPLLGFGIANLTVGLHLPGFCLIKLLFHHECWGCGLTRAFAELGKLHFQQAYDYNHLIVVVAPLLFIIWIKMLKKEFYKAK